MRHRPLARGTSTAARQVPLSATMANETTISSSLVLVPVRTNGEGSNGGTYGPRTSCSETLLSTYMVVVACTSDGNYVEISVVRKVRMTVYVSCTQLFPSHNCSLAMGGMACLLHRTCTIGFYQKRNVRRGVDSRYGVLFDPSLV